ncbi:MAG: hypothetical protein ACD_14C00038G0002 [uncultured bacterium]|nr:MAG: hypothetical protein ACD_14C00038G0002 [uncultured bacterium]KKQ60621.1 MAG: protein of unknown function with transmembrane region [Parcubacteria group bacterium GW2011_GWC1_38_22]KKQ80627.1 MAG: hypothetical protein UT03_C0021G0010 [Candidatus Moranbacteria bacterium GW2011_GWD2_38_7]
MQNQTTIKRTIIIAIFIVIIIIFSFFAYSIVAPDATCSDKKQNQSEKDIDCGGPCSPCKNLQAADLLIQEVSVVIGGGSTFDAVAKIYNPNDSLGAREFKYIFNLKDAAGEIIATQEGKDFILPVDTKYVTALGIETNDNKVAQSAEIIISEPEWTPLGLTEKPQLGVYNKKFDKAPTGEGSQAEGLLRNESNYDLNKISLVVILRGVDNKILGVNKTDKNVVRVKEQRDFRISWPYALPGSVQKMEVDAQSNVLDPQNFSMTR